MKQIIVLALCLLTIGCAQIADRLKADAAVLRRDAQELGTPSDQACAKDFSDNIDRLAEIIKRTDGHIAAKSYRALLKMRAFQSMKEGAKTTCAEFLVEMVAALVELRN